MKIVVVESPAKAKTIEKILGPDYKVLATYGHVCDLPSKDGSVRPDEDFAMDYVVDTKSEKHLAAIAKAAKTAERLILATDPDREGEAISWHVLNHLNGDVISRKMPVDRVVFHEITRGAVRDAVEHPRQIDMNLVNAQQARRALDYLVGFTLSPVLWRKVPGSRSAGRVQSVALRLVCEREKEIEAFKAREYWTVDADLRTPAGQLLTARLTHLDGQKLDKFALGNEADAKAAVDMIEARTFSVAKVERKQVRRNPAPPFTTSTLQQEASRKLGMSAKQTMRIAQKLYEGVDIGGETVGLITYMRTDSVTLANDALEACRNLIGETYGADYVPEKPRFYKTKSRNAQEAHEAIRPTVPSRTPKAVAGHLDNDGLRLYELIWKRTIACQMASAKVDQVAVDFDCPDGQAVLRATGSVIAFDGFIRVYSEGRDDVGDGDPDAERRLPQVSERDTMERVATRKDQHFTEPPPRFTEATLVKRLEELGIGRPSTYASIISVLQDRGYVALEKKRFTPESRGRLVTAFLESFFEQYVAYDFTADLEDQLDRISNGQIEWKTVLREFWNAFEMAVGDISHLRVAEVLDKLDEVLGPHIFPADESGFDRRACRSCADGRLSLKLGKFGAFIGCSNYPDCRYTRQLEVVGDENGDSAGIDGPKVLGQNEDGLEISLRKGPYGWYVQAGEADNGSKPKRTSVPKTTAPETVDLQIALGLLSLPRDVGMHPESGKKIVAGLGRFGPYLRHDGKFKSIPSGDDVLTIGINRAVDLLAQPDRGRGGAKPLHVIGKHPDDETELAVFSGRYGPYIKYKRIFATVPKDMQPEQVTLDTALQLLAEKAEKKKAGSKSRGGATAKPKSKAKSGTKAKATTKPKAKTTTKKSTSKRTKSARKSEDAVENA